MGTKKIGYDEEELFAHTRMSLGDHIEELRGALWSAMKGFLIAMILGFFVADRVLDFLIAPLHKVLVQKGTEQLEKERKAVEDTDERIVEEWYINPAELAGCLGLDASKFSGKERVPIYIEMTKKQQKIKAIDQKLENLKTEPPVTALGITEPFMVWFKVSMYAGFVLASPWVFYQMWMFIAAGLYPHEKKYIHIFLPLSICLFIAGVCLCQFLVLPLGIRWLLDFSSWLGVRTDLRLSEWLSFALLVPLIFGLAFQLPLVMFGLERVGIFDVQTYRSKRRIAIFIICLVSSLANASPDPISMTMLAVPLCVLYEGGILLCKYWPRPELDLDVEESEEMVEV